MYDIWIPTPKWCAIERWALFALWPTMAYTVPSRWRGLRFVFGLTARFFGTLSMMEAVLAQHQVRNQIDSAASVLCAKYVSLYLLCTDADTVFVALDGRSRC